MKRFLKGLIVLSSLLFFISCGAIFSEQKYGIANKAGFTVNGSAKVSDILKQFGAPSFCYSDEKYAYMVFDGTYARTILGLLTNVEKSALVVIADKKGNVISSQLVNTGTGQTICGWPGLFAEDVVPQK